MGIQREYFPSDTLKLINQSEGLAVRGGVRGTTAALGIDDKKGAHTIGRHLVNSLPGGKGTTGSRGAGVAFTDFRDRFLKDGQDNLSSAWAGKGEMAILLCELLNSRMGQHALGLMDRGVHRVVVHYFNEGKLAGLFGGLMGQTKFQESSILVTPSSESFVKTLLTKPDGSPVIDSKTKLQKEIMKKVTTPKSAVANVKARDIIAVVAVLDRFRGGLHVQTLYPSSEPVTSYCEWNVGHISLVASTDRRGALTQRMVPPS